MNGPVLIEWQLPADEDPERPRLPVVLASVLLRGSEAPDKATNKVVLRQWIPYGVIAWRRTGKTEWRPLTDLPAEWGLSRIKAPEVKPHLVWKKGEYVSEKTDEEAEE